MQVEHERGYLILAQNNSTTDYVGCARALARSIKFWEPNAKVCLLTDSVDNDHSVFDYCRVFPFGDQALDKEWKLSNDWQCFYASPFRQTIKIEADMLITRDISHWFEICCKKDLVVMIGAKNYHNQLAKERHYRAVFDANSLPDAYNAITYWRLSHDAKIFFDTVRNIFDNWKSVMSILRKGIGQPVNTDLAYAIALVLLGPEKYTLPGNIPSMIHMKAALNGIADEKWTRELVWEFQQGSLRINTIEQMYPVHYHVKEFASEIEKHYEQQ